MGSRPGKVQIRHRGKARHCNNNYTNKCNILLFYYSIQCIKCKLAKNIFGIHM